MTALRALWNRLIDRHVDVDENGMSGWDYIEGAERAKEVEWS